MQPVIHELLKLTEYVLINILLKTLFICSYLQYELNVITDK